MRTAGVELRSEGVVRVMHPDKGMGVEFTKSTPEHRALLEKFLRQLAESPETVPELLVEPEGLENAGVQNSTVASAPAEADPLLEIFRNHAALAAEPFVELLRKQRGVAAAM